MAKTNKNTDFGGLIAPHDLDMERAVLSSVILESDAILKANIGSDFTVDLFYKEANQLIAKALIEMYQKGTKIDMLTLIMHLKSNNTLEQVGGALYVSEVMQGSNTADHFDTHLLSLKELALRRRLIGVSQKASAKAFRQDNDIFDVYAETQNELDGGISSVIRNGYSQIGDISDEIIEESKKVAVHGIRSGVPTGLVMLDNLTSGWQKSDLIIIAGRPAMGKEIKNSSRVYTPNGYTIIGEIKVGESIVGSDGKTYKCTGVYPQGKKDVYRVYFDDRTFVDSGLEHQWEVTDRKIRKTKKQTPKVVTTVEMIDNIRLKDGRLNYSIRICSPIEFISKEVKIDPYVLGVYLGDGNSTSGYVSISNVEKDILNNFFEKCINNGDKKGHVSKRKINHNLISSNRKKSNMYKSLEFYGLDKLKSYEKFIPKDYLYNDIEKRVSLLRGLVDTDGFICSSGRSAIEYSTTSKQLCEDILELVRGLGGKASYQVKQGSYSGIKTRIYYRMYLSLPSEIIPVSSEKHLSKYSPNKKYHKKFITDIVKMDYKEEMTCITVDSPDSLFITDGYNLTHNTSVAISVCLNPTIEDNKPIAVFSLEMSKQQLVARIQSSISGFNVGKIVKKQYGIQDILSLEERVKTLKNVPLYIDDTPAISLLELRTKARKLHREKKIQMIVIDYLQLMTSGLGIQNQEQEISTISRGLKALAKELNIPVIALSQLSRSVEARGGDKKPQLSDLRSSGAIEQDADMVLFCYRPEYYNIDTYEIGGQEYGTHGLFMLLVAKHRNGELGEVPLRFLHAQTRVDNHPDFTPRSNTQSSSSSQSNENTFSNTEINKQGGIDSFESNFDNTVAPF